MARPTKLNNETMKRLSTAIRNGSTYLLACSYAGIDYTTLRKWIIQAEEDLKKYEAKKIKKETIFIQLFDSIKKAEGEITQEALMQIRKSGRNSWQAYAWLLERRYPGEYGRQLIDMKHSGDETAPIVVQVVTKSVADKMNANSK